MAKKRKIPAKPNPFAKEVNSPKYKSRVVKSRKNYDRNREKNRVDE